MGDEEESSNPDAWPFTVWNEFEIGEAHPTFPNLYIFDVELVLGDEATVGDVRASLANHMKVPVSDVCLLRRTVRSRRGALPEVPTVAEMTEIIPVDEKETPDVVKASGVMMDDDNSPFPLTRRTRSFITVLKS